MMQSVFALVITLTFLAASHASGVPALEISVGAPDNVKLTEEDLFVVWKDDCREGPAPKSEKKLELLEENFKYVPRALVGQIDQVLSVRNADKIQHNSFALKNISFDSKQQTAGSAYPVKLVKPGVTKIFCRIHPKMISEILVLKKNSCFSEVAGSLLATKKFVLNKVKTETGKIWLWSPRLKGFHSTEQGKGASVEFKLAKSDFIETVASPKSGPSGDAY